MFTLFLCMTLSMVQVYQDIPVKFSTCQELRYIIPVNLWSCCCAHGDEKNILLRCCNIKTKRLSLRNNLNI